jgi:LAO/AO transport system kinase
VVVVSSVPPPSGIEELQRTLDQGHERLDLPARRTRSRRLSAIREFAAERGELALRALGGRREAERFLAGQDPETDVGALVAALEKEAGE